MTCCIFRALHEHQQYLAPLLPLWVGHPHGEEVEIHPSLLTQKHLYGKSRCPNLFVWCQFKFRQQVNINIWYHPMTTYLQYAIFIYLFIHSYIYLLIKCHYIPSLCLIFCILFIFTFIFVIMLI